ncbi:lipopolysaccharide biosynthesis protein [Cryobacterium luteum]|nr:lipopolysaccharide biosynthesis protein [Cryobacterium luteum]SEO13269.1 Membrane protein involved in the export of O-antigen and teichoic acid [Cryobacterium luteum]
MPSRTTRNPSAEGRRRQSPLVGFSQILAGTAVGQIVTFLAMPVLSRLYAPELFGVLTFALSIVAVLVPVALLGFDQAVLLPRADSSVTPIATAGVSSLAVVCCILACLVLWSPLTSTIDSATRPFLAWSLPILLFVTGVVSLLAQLAIRAGRYGSIGHRNTAQSIAITASQFAFINTTRFSGFNGLVTGTLIGTSLGAVLLSPYVKRYAHSFTLRQWFQSVRRYWRFPLIFAPMTSLTLLAQQAPVLFVIYWFGVSDGGQIGMAERIVAVPLALVGMAVSSVFTGEISQAIRTDERHMVRIYLKTSMWLGVASGLVGLGLFFLAPIVLPLFLGTGWQGAAQIAQAMAIVATTRMLASPVRSVFRVLERARILVTIELSRAAFLVITIAFATTSDLDLLASLTLIFIALAVGDLISWFCGLVVVWQANSGVATIRR